MRINIKEKASECKVSRSVAWIMFGLLTWLLNLLAHQKPALVEQWYSRGIYQVVRCVLDWTLGLLPFAAFYVFWLAVVVYWVFEWRNRATLQGLKAKIAYWGLKILGFGGLLYGLFFWMWGFNYARVPLVQQMGLRVEPLDTATLWRDLRQETQSLDAVRQMLVGNDSIALNDQQFWPVDAEETVRAAVETWLAHASIPVIGRVRGRNIWPAGTLYKFGAAGLYWPFVGEGNLEGGLHPLQKLPVMAHEMSHGYGFSDEGICNFIAYVACCDHPNAYLAYCARFDYWRTLADNCHDSDPERFKLTFLPQLSKGIRADERAIHVQQAKFNEFAPALRYKIYDNYLKAQGIETGMLNYEEVLMLVHAWRAARE